MKQLYIVVLVFFVCFGISYAQENTVTLYTLSSEGVGQALGTVSLEESPYGLLLRPDLRGLPPGIHGFHVHENPQCLPAEKNGTMVPGLAAGGHYDPEQTGIHKGPYQNGHLGDLPPLFVTEDGRAVVPVLAPRLKISDLQGRSLMIHEHGDNYSDHPVQLGGGGGRLACGVIQ